MRTTTPEIASLALLLGLLRYGTQFHDPSEPLADTEHMITCGLKEVEEAYLDPGWDHPDHEETLMGCHGPGKPEYSSYIFCNCGKEHGYWVWQPTPLEFAIAIAESIRDSYQRYIDVLAR
jgi:hypothetical protein